MPDSLQEQIPSPLQLRDQLEAMVRRDLLDPAGGPEEEVDEPPCAGATSLACWPRVCY